MIRRCTLATALIVTLQSSSTSAQTSAVREASIGTAVVRVDTTGHTTVIVAPGSSAAAAWTAALTSSSAAKQGILGKAFTIRGSVDGAGAMTATTMLALMRDDVVNADVAIAGSILPDGTIGVAANLPQELRTAASAGKKVFGYPAGQGSSADDAGVVVDVEALGARLGVRVAAVATLREAYALLTGIEIDAPAVVDTRRLTTPPELLEGLQIRIDMWRASAESAFSRVQPILNTLTPEVRKSLVWVSSPLFQAVKRAAAFEKAGQLLAAEQKWMEASVAAAVAEDALAILEAARPGRPEQAFNVLLPYLDLEEQGATMLEEVGGALGAGGTNVGTINAVLAAASVVESLALVGAGKSGLQAATDTIKELESGDNAANADRIERFLLLLLKTAPVLARAEATLAAARMDLAFADPVASSSSSSSSSPAKMRALTQAYIAAAIAGRTNFQTTIGLDDAASSSFAFTEPSWATAAFGVSVAKASLGKSTEIDQIVALAASAQAYLAASSLHNKYADLLYKDGVVGRPSALAAQLIAARGQALAAIAEVQQTAGTIPPRLLVEFKRADELQAGSDDDKIEALTVWWRARVAADLLAVLNRADNEVVKPTLDVEAIKRLEPVVKKPIKPLKKLPVRKPPPKNTLKQR